jgi:predicted PurR-regulated permease PerM
MIPPSAPVSSPPAVRSAPVEVITPARIQERRAFGFLALAALAALVRLALPVGVGLFLGALMGFILEPFYEWLKRRGARAGMAAAACVLGAMTAATSTVLGMMTMVVTRGIAVLAHLRAQLAPGGEARAFAEHGMTLLASWHVDTTDFVQRLENETVSVGARATAVATQIAGLTISALLALFFMTLAAYFFLRYWNDIVTRSERILPFEPRHTHALLEQFRSVGREVLLGTVLTGIVQGVLAAVGYWVTGVPESAFFGALTAFASLLPGVGALLVWLPIGIVRILTGHAVAGVVELVYSALAVGLVCDYVVRPRLVGRQRSIPSIFMFIALFGGVEVFGVIGLILGPVVVTLSLAILRTYETEVAEHAGTT